MAFSLYDATVVMAKGALMSLDTMLLEAEKHPNSANFFNARLIEDMQPLTFQVSYATSQACTMAAKLSNKEKIELAGDLDTYQKMHTRIRQALNALNETDKDTVNNLGESQTSFKRREDIIEVPVKAVAEFHDMPNIYFHVCIAYAILRKEGVPLQKRHWSRAFVSDYIGDSQ